MTSIVISRDKPREPAFDYDQLRREAIAHVQALSGKIWTDYNLHDPGVTILEQLCYAITDLAYRTDFPIDEILADKHGNIDAQQHAFYAKAAILSTAPVTVKDYRKLLLDEVDELENVWIEPAAPPTPGGATKGMYRVLMQVQDELMNTDATPATLQQVTEAVQRCMMAYRNIGEDVADFTVLQPQEISLKAEIMVDSRYDLQELMAHILNALETVLHPPVRFFTEAELLEKGYTVEAIYSGPLLKNGFIIDSDLQPRSGIVDPAALVKAVSGVTGVTKVKSLYIAGDDGNYTARPLTLKENYYPLLQASSDNNEIKIFSDKYEYRLKEVAFWNTYQKMKIIARRRFVGQKTGETDPPIKAAYRNLGWYYSLQHHFPDIYGIGTHGLGKHASAKRKAQARQLKAYLLFFEQLLANYLAQLGSMGSFFSPLAGDVMPYTYAAQPLYNVPHVSGLLHAFTEQGGALTWEQFMEDTGNGYVKSLQQEKDSAYQERKERVLDHLLARFNLSLMKYPVTLYEQLYGSGEKVRVSRELEWKAAILRDAVQLTANRLRAFNYTTDPFDPGEYAGYEKWMRQLLYIQGAQRKRLTAVFDADHLKVQVSKQHDHLHLWLTKEYRLKDEVIKVSVQDLPEAAGPAQQPVVYDYGSQPVSFLKQGLSTDNYRIVYDEERREHLVVYRHWHHEVWRVVIRAATRGAALHALQDMTAHLRRISVESEGFYLVEHLLLKPRHTERSFGFRLYDRNGSLLKEHPYWYTFDERTAAIRQLQEEAAQQQGYFVYYVKHGYGRLLREDFFRFGLTVIFPSWPARFQLPEFRSFAEELFRQYTPVQFIIQHKWLGVGDMRNFETAYLEWLQALREKRDLQPVTAALIETLAPAHFFDR
jgi:hypothetical protein